MTDKNFVTPQYDVETTNARTRRSQGKVDRLLTGTTEKITRRQRQRAANQADQLSNRAWYGSTAALLNRALTQLIGMTYEPAPYAGLANVDGETLRLLIPVPWSTRSYHLYGLTRGEADIMRALMLGRARTSIKHVPLYVYDDLLFRWTVNLYDYPNARAGAMYVDAYALTARDVNAAHDYLTQRRNTKKHTAERGR